MQPYPNYSQQMINPYPNSYNPMLSPQQRLMQMEQQYPQFAQQNQFMQQPVQQQPQGIVGKIVNDFSELTANDVPMNGSAAFFPKADGSEMQVRSWNANGTIQTVVYKPVLDQNQAEGLNIQQTDFNALNEDVRALREDIKGMREIIEKSINVSTPKTTSSRGKKEVSADE